VVVGHYDPPFVEALAERWHGTSWTAKNLPRSNGLLSAVSCSSATCAGVGSFGARTLAENFGSH
jgi:hypothetical protein